MRFSLVVLLALLLGCAASRGDHLYSNSVEEQGDRRVGQYISSDWSFQTSSFWIEGPEGLILIDTQFLPSALRKLIRYGEQRTGKASKLAIVLHPNPDRFNGTAWLQSQEVPVVTSEQVRDLIADVHAKWSPVFFEKYSMGGYPRTLALPDSLGSSTRELSAGGLTVKVHVLGSGCSPAHLVIEWEGHLFVGDLVANGSHSWFENGRVDEWLHRLEELRALRPKWIHPGHGLSGGPELLDQQAEYLRAVVEAVAAARKQGLPHRDALGRAKEELTRRYPHHLNPLFLPMLLGAELSRQAAESTP
ncbi:MBL fold metallo-hydrolase [Hyalangium gracile]|uniref:MBL fold metallo-hydrolase n=1 Tax=Hyalangium gracile TaxID=394092 RepID=UPI001CCAACD2|nr:MBL fold metallo-hydrolase [Hyalangium gracile]